jgi:dTDP-4-dehydrorhamnose 3,5-epimerase-like enzyme
MRALDTTHPITTKGRRMDVDHDPRVPLKPPHTDARGAIQPILDQDFKSAQLITSVAGSTRASHYHRNDSHYMFLVSGSFDYYWRTADSGAPLGHIVVQAGELVFTPAMVEHLVVFREDSAFINFSDQRRDQEAYEADIVRLQMSPPQAPPAG